MLCIKFYPRPQSPLQICRARACAYLCVRVPQGKCRAKRPTPLLTDQSQARDAHRKFACMRGKRGNVTPCQNIRREKTIDYARKYISGKLHASTYISGKYTQLHRVQERPSSVRGGHTVSGADL
jgi:hypothetical protein